MMRYNVKKIIDINVWKQKHKLTKNKQQKFFQSYSDEEVKKEVDYTVKNIGAMLEHFQDEQMHPVNTAFGALHCLFDYILHCAPSEEKGLELIQFVLDSHQTNKKQH